LLFDVKFVVAQLATVGTNALTYFMFNFSNIGSPPVGLDISVYPLNGSAQFYVANALLSNGALMYPTLACATPGVPRKQCSSFHDRVVAVNDIVGLCPPQSQAAPTLLPKLERMRLMARVLLAGRTRGYWPSS
jgi:hypothetical protein